MWNIFEEIMTVANKLKFDVTQISEKQSNEIIKEIANKYSKGIKNACLWEELKNYYSINDKDAWQWVSEFIGDS